ncbi:MAG: PEP-CTERM sorting domain-containing protein [Desulfobacula sp.]|nr:PEP-CTERM sorting domain-containing protein [Desulfobacula sp.]
MKKILIVLMAGMMFLAVSGNVFAAIMTYTFQGTVISITKDAAIVNDLITVGDYAEFSFNVDFDANGTSTYPVSDTYPDGLVTQRTDHENDSEIVDYFWADYIGGTDIGSIGEITDPYPLWPKEINQGLSVNRKDNYGNIVQDTGYLYGGSIYNWVSIENYAYNVQDWRVGTTGFNFRHIVRNQPVINDDGEMVWGEAWIRGNLTLLSAVSSQAPVPEPATMLLFGLGLLGLAGISRKKA